MSKKNGVSISEVFLPVSSVGKVLAVILSPVLGTKFKKNMDQLEEVHKTAMKRIKILKTSSVKNIEPLGGFNHEKFEKSNICLNHLRCHNREKN